MLGWLRHALVCRLFSAQKYRDWNAAEHGWIPVRCHHCDRCIASWHPRHGELP